MLFVVNAPGFFLSHRLPIAEAAQHMGLDVEVATGPGAEERGIVEAGLVHHRLPLSRSGKNPLTELRTLWALFRLFRSVRPDIVHLVTIKPVLYGGLAARWARVPAVVAAVSGLGAVFLAKGRGSGALRRVIDRLYRTAFRHRRIRVIFQNDDDRARFVDAGAAAIDETVLIPGSGVDLAQYAAVAETSGPPVVSMASRLLRDKGVFEFVEAARELKSRHPVVRFLLIGAPDPGNPATLTDTDIEQLRRENVVELLGQRSDIAALFAQSSIVVLPSYREGLPKVLIEAAACGRAVVTTDVPGCRDAIEAGKTGLLVPARNAALLAEAIETLILNADRRQAMGHAGRLLAERRFSIGSVVDAHLEVYRELLEGAWS